MQRLTEFKCPCCGGAVEFDSTVQKMKCPYCDTEFDIEALRSEEAAIENAQQDSDSWRTGAQSGWQQGETDGMFVYICNSCGGEIIADETTGATACPYCGNPVVVKAQFSGALRPDLVIPFKLDKKAAKEALTRYVSGKKLLPKVFKDQNHIDEIKGIYVPYWLFSCDARAQATYRGERIHTWSDRDYNYTQTSVFSIVRAGEMGFDALPVDGSSKMDDALMESLEPFSVSEAVDFNTAYLAGYLADKFDVDAQSSVHRANERIKASAVDALRNTVHGYTAVQCRSAQTDTVNGSYQYALYPVWILNTTWQGKKFTFAVNGQTGKIVGDLPLDKGAFWRWTGLLTAGLSVLIYFLMYFLG